MLSSEELSVDDIVDQVSDTIREVRRVVDGLQPSVLEDVGLVPALRILVDDLGRDAGLTVELDAPGAMPDLPVEAASAAYRVVTEALANVARHSRAARCRVRVACADGMLQVEVRDDGCGFDPADAVGMGLRNIAGRAALAQGTATVDSVPGAGTTVTLRVPARPGLAEPAATGGGA